MGTIFLIIIGLFAVLVIQILEVYLVIKINHDLNDDLNNLIDDYEDLKTRVTITERRMYVTEDILKGAEDGRQGSAESGNADSE